MGSCILSLSTGVQIFSKSGIVKILSLEERKWEFQKMMRRIRSFFIRWIEEDGEEEKWERKKPITRYYDNAMYDWRSDWIKNTAFSPLYFPSLLLSTSFLSLSLLSFSPHLLPFSVWNISFQLQLVNHKDMRDEGKNANKELIMMMKGREWNDQIDDDERIRIVTLRWDEPRCIISLNCISSSLVSLPLSPLSSLSLPLSLSFIDTPSRSHSKIVGKVFALVILYSCEFFCWSLRERSKNTLATFLVSLSLFLSLDSRLSRYRVVSDACGLLITILLSLSMFSLSLSFFP